MPKPTDTATVSRLERGECPTCGLNVALRKGGLTREHTHQGAKCAGSGEAAKPVDALPAPTAAELEHVDTPAEAAAMAADPNPTKPPRSMTDADKALIAKARARTQARPASVPAAGGATLMRLPLEDFEPNPANPRRNMGTDEDLAELGASIATRGLVEPIVGYRRDDGKVELIAGGRRLEAARRNGTVDALDVLIREGDTEADRRELALIENAMRKDLEPLEEARAFQALIDDFGYTQLGLGERLGRSQGHVSRRLSLLKLPAHIQDAVGAQVGVRDAEELAKQPAKVVDKVWDDLGVGRGTKPDEVARQLPGALRDVKAAQERDRKDAAALKQLKAEGTRIIDPASQANGWDNGADDLEELEDRILTDDELEKLNDATREQVTHVLVDKHKTCPGHAAYISRGEITYVCTNAKDLHPYDTPKPNADAGEAKARKARQQWSKNLDAAAASRLLVMKDLLAKRTSANATVHIITAYLETQDANFRGGLYGLPPEATRAMRDLLGYETTPKATWPEMLEAAVPERGLFTVALALSLAAGDRELLTYDQGEILAPATVRHLRFLADEAGYQPAAWELEALQVTADATADDTPHQVDAGSVDDWEDPEPPAADTEAIITSAAAAEMADAALGDPADA